MAVGSCSASGNSYNWQWECLVHFIPNMLLSYVCSNFVPQKEETFQVVIDLVKNSSCFKDFTISVDVSEIFMQQFWYSIKKVQGMDSYEFLLANKKCMVNANVFRIILDICPRVKGVNFNDVPDDDTTLSFLIELGYKGPLYRHTNMFVDHMHHPWRTLAAIINKCLSVKTIRNDKLRKSRINILWGMFYRENVDYPELIWEDLAYQIDHRKKKRSRRKNMSFPRFTKEYRLSIPETMLTEAIKQIESYQMFIKYFTESKPEPEPEPVKRKTSSKRRVKKKVTLSADDNIISDAPATTLKLDKSISKTEVKEAKAARQVYATHARILTKSTLERNKRRKSGKVTFDPPKKLKGVPSLTPKEQEAADIIQAFKESKKTSKRQLSTRGSSEGTGTIPGILDESIVISATLSEGTEQESEYSDEDKLDDEEKDDKEGDADDENDETKSNEDDIYKYKIHVPKDKGGEMLNTEVEDSDKVSTVKDTTDAEINLLLEVKIQYKVPHIQPLFVLTVPVSVIFEPSVLTLVQESPSIATATTLPPPSVSTTSFVPQQTTTLILITTDVPIITIAVSESDARSAV
nr:hypothetical protein [Tanacetum cinerariifolium]